MDATRPVPTDLSHYLGMLRRHWWVLLLLTALGVAAAALLTQAQPKVYRSSTSVLVQPAGQDTNVVGGRTRGDINLDTEAQIVRSTAVAAGAATLLGSQLTPDELARDVSVQVPPNTSVLVIVYSAGTPEAARAGSHAFAEAYLRNREETARAELDTQITALNTKIQQLGRGLSDINTRLARTTNNSPQQANLESQRTNSLAQLNDLTSKVNQLTTATVGGGRIISEARTPDAPSSPDVPLNLATGLLLGLLVGLGVAIVRDRLDRRVRTAADVRERGRIAVLAALDERTVPRFDDVLQPYGPGGRVFNRLRNEVLASLGPDDRIIVVTGACRGPATTLVAANLAAALARTGSDVVLVGAHLPDSLVDTAPLARLFGVAAVPGLSDLLAGRVPLAEAAQYAPRIPTLRVIPNGGTATAAGLIQSQGLRDLLQALRQQARFVVIEAPSTASSADAQSLASLADAAILTVELRRASRPDLADAVEQLRRVGTPLLGAVALPRVAGPAPDGPAPAGPAVPLTADGTDPARRGRDADPDRTAPLRPRPVAGRRPAPAARSTDGYRADDDTAVIDRTALAALDRHADTAGRVGLADGRAAAGEADGRGR